MSTVEEAYRQAMDAMTPAEKFARVEGFLSWTRSLLARQIKAELGDVSEERIKSEVAIRMYGSDPRFRKLLEQREANGSP